MKRAVSPKSGGLLRVLGFAFALAICVGSIVGGGILRTPGAVVDRVPDVTFVLILWALGGLHALLGANVVSELITSVPKAGGLYVPSRRAFGDFAGLLVGWSDWLLNAAAIAALALACGEFAALIEPSLASRTTSVALTVLGALYLLNWLGVREGSVAQKLGSALKCLLLILLIGTIFLLVPPAAPQAAQPAGGTGVSFLAVVVGYQLVYGAYTGWANPIYFVEEDKHASSNIPKAMALSILAVTAVYVVMNYALLHALPIGTLRTADLPASISLVPVFGPASTAVIAGVALVIVISCLNGLVMVIPRVLYGLGRDGLFLPVAQHVNRGGTPDVALLMSAALTMLLALTGEFETVFLLMGAITIFTMVVTDLSLFVLRRKEPDLPRPYRAIGYPLLPGLLLLIDTLLLCAVLASDPWSGLYMALLIALCIPVGLWLRRSRAEPKPAMT
jgi:APA family basic amino acid/polyamine antiporter